MIGEGEGATVDLGVGVGDGVAEGPGEGEGATASVDREDFGGVGEVAAEGEGESDRGEEGVSGAEVEIRLGEVTKAGPGVERLPKESGAGTVEVVGGGFGVWIF